MLNCDKCGYANELGRIFCHQCGAKLDLSTVKSPSQGGKRFKTKKKSTSRVSSGNLLFAAGLIALTAWMGYRAMQMPDLEPLTLPPGTAKVAKEKYNQMVRTVRQKEPFAVKISENDLNGFFQAMPLDGKDSGKGLRYVYKEIRFEIGESDVSVILIGDLRVGENWKHPLYMRFTGIPRIEDGAFTFEPVAGAIGTLPLHPLVVSKTPLPARFYGNILSNLGSVRALIDSLTAIEAKSGVVEAKFSP
jgi:hypothetical protein